MSQNFAPNPIAHPSFDSAQDAPSHSTQHPLSHPATQLLDHSDTPAQPDRDRVRILVIGTPPGIDAICHSLHVKGFARLDEWSPLLPHDAGRHCRILTRQVRLP